MGSFALARATRFETTTRFTKRGPLKWSADKPLFINMVPGTKFVIEMNRKFDEGSRKTVPPANVRNRTFASAFPAEFPAALLTEIRTRRYRGESARSLIIAASH